jgi:DNA topoisomerase IA
VPVKRDHAQQHFTEPPPRFSEASLVKELERLGIGRPSTYASIISVLAERRYVSLEQRRFFPTPLGETVEKVMVKQFPATSSTSASRRRWKASSTRSRTANSRGRRARRVLDAVPARSTT